jgi:hypothetical protein
MFRDEILKEIKANELKDITVVFIKKDGTKRIMKCMYGVRKEDSKGMNYDAEEKGLVSVFDTEKKEYRVIPIANTLKLITTKGKFEIVDRKKLNRR